MRTLTKILIPREIFLLLVLSTGLLNHVILIPNILLAAGRDSWISVLIAYFIALLFLILVHYIIKHSPKGGFFQYLQNRIGKFSYLYLTPVLLFLLGSVYVTFRDLLIWLNAYFLADLPLLLINIVLIVACLLTTFAGIKYMAIASGFLLPVVIILGFFIAITNTPMKDPGYLFPLFSDGYMPVLKGIVYVLSGLLEIYIVVIIQPFTEAKIKFRHLFILLSAFTFLILGPLTASIMEFGPIEATTLRYPAYEQWRLLNIGDYISHLDFFALYQWLSGALIRIGLFMYLIGYLLSHKIKDDRLNWKMVIGIYIVLFILTNVNIETYEFYKYLYKYLIPIIFGFFITIIIFSAFTLLVLKKRDGQHEKNKNQFKSST
ncbi:spore germination protein [Cytobacillus spongiae]|jgi:spore germination protein (amino acid permease)|uniref:endospore germination permease n=1 Tax=Cytobacillus spongiae TaxID=2901381 RepID=UPI001F426FD2|nr:endospore germination permease [Cytobacillus spongiae]UII54312.1 spore germination protein [Cytobacillus spongiae]